MEEIKEEVVEEKKDKPIEESRTIEQILKESRKERNWSYLDVVVALNKVGASTTAKQVKGWETGILHPDLDIIYKLAEIYDIPSKNMIAAKNNSYYKDYNSMHMTISKWLSHLAIFALRLFCIFFVLALIVGIVWSIIYFLININSFSWIK